jgi:signal transduction histidine kinase
VSVHTLYRLRTGDRPRKGLTYRMVITGGVMILLKIGTFALLFVAIIHLQSAGKVASHSAEVLASANRLEKLIVDLETGARGYILTGNQRFLRSWNSARAALPGQAAELERISAADSAQQGARARQVVGLASGYLNDYSVRLVDTERTDPAAARTRVVSGEGEQRLAALRDGLAGFENAQRDISAAKERHYNRAAREAIITAAASALASVSLIFLLITYLTGAIVHPVRRASKMAGRLAEGDLTVRMPETSPGEIGMLENNFNRMADTLQASGDQLSRVAEEQGALRRVATLVARGVSPAELFSAVAAELGGVLGADYTQIARFEPDDTATMVGVWNAPGIPVLMPPLDGHWPVEDETIAAEVLRTGRPARMSDYENNPSVIGGWVARQGIRYVVGCPVKVEGSIWGVMLIYSLRTEPRPGFTEDRMLEFVELVGTAIANAQGRSELLASRARVVAASDESRRRIERNLHDGAQQQLVSLGLRLRAAEAAVEPWQRDLREQLSATVKGLASVLEELQEISRGLDPAILTRHGLGPALRSLARRSSVPVDLKLHLDRRLPEQVEVAIYYTLAEALTNVAKYARASMVDVELRLEETTVRLSVHDDGIGGADLAGGSGLVGLRDRVEALGGRIKIVSPAGQGTTLLADLPVGPPSAAGVRYPAANWSRDCQAACSLVPDPWQRPVLTMTRSSDRVVSGPKRVFGPLSMPCMAPFADDMISVLTK